MGRVLLIVIVLLTISCMDSCCQDFKIKGITMGALARDTKVISDSRDKGYVSTTVAGEPCKIYTDTISDGRICSITLSFRSSQSMNRAYYIFDKKYKLHDGVIRGTWLDVIKSSYFITIEDFDIIKEDDKEKDELLLNDF